MHVWLNETRVEQSEFGAKIIYYSLLCCCKGAGSRGFFVCFFLFKNITNTFKSLIGMWATLSSEQLRNNVTMGHFKKILLAALSIPYHTYNVSNN